MFNPNYQKNPIEELNDKFIQTYNSKDNPKAKGVDFSVKVPKSWKSQDAKIGLNRTTMQELDRTQKRSLTGQ